MDETGIREKRFEVHDHLRGARPAGRRRRARAAVVHDGSHPAEQRLLVDVADDEAIVPVV